MFAAGDVCGALYAVSEALGIGTTMEGVENEGGEEWDREHETSFGYVVCEFWGGAIENDAC